MRTLQYSRAPGSAAAVTGQIAGVLWGHSAIPQRWLERIAQREEIERKAPRLWTLSRAARRRPASR